MGEWAIAGCADGLVTGRSSGKYVDFDSRLLADRADAAGLERRTNPQ